MVEPAHGVAPRSRHRDTLRRHYLFERAEPDRIGRTLTQQPRPLPQRLLISRDTPGMRRIER